MAESEAAIALIGISHKTAPVDIRERVALDAGEQAFVLRALHDRFEIDGTLVLSTCNRTEVYLSGKNSRELVPEVRKWLDDYKRCGHFTDDRYCYVTKDQDAVRHFFRVISSLESQIIGEPQITGQVKEAYNLAQELKTTDIYINKFMNLGLQAQKKVRSDTFLADGAVSVSFAGVELARKIFNELDNKHALLIGAGETAQLAAKHFVDKGIRGINILNRTLAKAEELAALFHGNAFDTAQLSAAFEDIDIVISATSSTDYVITADFIGQISKQRHYKPIFFVDLAMPRDIDPEINEIDGVFLYNLDDLHEIVQMNIEKRKQEIPKAGKIIDRFVAEFEKWASTHTAAPTITRLRRYFENIRRGEMSRLKKRLPEEGFAEIDYLTLSIVNKLMHQHIKTLKNNSSDPILYQQHIDLMHSLYELDHDK